MVRTLAQVLVATVLVIAGTPAVAVPISRCVLQVQGKTYLDGPCDYEEFAGGSFSIGTTEAGEKPTDFAYVLLGSTGEEVMVPSASTTSSQFGPPSLLIKPDGNFAVTGGTAPLPTLATDTPIPTVGYWSGNPRARRADDPLGDLRRDGACWVNATARVCAYR